jgi:hypothetical protein
MKEHCVRKHAHTKTHVLDCTHSSYVHPVFDLFDSGKFAGRLRRIHSSRQDSAGHRVRPDRDWPALGRTSRNQTETGEADFKTGGRLRLCTPFFASWCCTRPAGVRYDTDYDANTALSCCFMHRYGNASSTNVVNPVASPT